MPIHCEQCGREPRANAKFCKYCGADIVVVPVTQAAAAIASTVGAKKQFCENCRNRITGDAQFCNKCGKPVITDNSLLFLKDDLLNKGCWVIVGGFAFSLILPWLSNPWVFGWDSNYFAALSNTWDLIWSENGRGIFICFFIPPLATAYAGWLCLRNRNPRPMARIKKEYKELMEAGIMGVLVSFMMYWQFSKVATVGSGVALFMLTSIAAVVIGYMGEEHVKESAILINEEK